MDVQQWEYTGVSSMTTSAGTFVDRLNVLGAEGWELVGFASADKTIGFNSLVGIARRPIVPPAPASGPPEWHPDPCGRWEIRYWDGARWTAHVANRTTKTRGVDPPQTLAASNDEGEEVE